MRVAIPWQIELSIEGKHTLFPSGTVAQPLDRHLTKQRHQAALTRFPDMTAEHPIGAFYPFPFRLLRRAPIQMPLQQPSYSLSRMTLHFYYYPIVFWGFYSSDSSMSSRQYRSSSLCISAITARHVLDVTLSTPSSKWTR